MARDLSKGPACIHVQGCIKAGLFHFATKKTEPCLELAACWGPWKRGMVGAGQGRRVERPKGGAGCGPISQASASVASHSTGTLVGMDTVMPPLHLPLRVIVGSPCKNAGGSVQKDGTLFSNHGLTVGLGEGQPCSLQKVRRLI